MRSQRINFGLLRTFLKGDFFPLQYFLVEVPPCIKEEVLAFEHGQG